MESSDPVWKLFLDALRSLASPPDVQLARFPDFVAKADELALEFGHWYEVTRGLHQFTAEQSAQLNTIDQRLRALSGPNEVWSEQAILTHPFWAEMRQLAIKALRSLGHEPGPPGPVTGTYIAG